MHRGAGGLTRGGVGNGSGGSRLTVIATPSQRMRTRLTLFLVVAALATVISLFFMRSAIHLNDGAGKAESKWAATGNQYTRSLFKHRGARTSALDELVVRQERQIEGPLLTIWTVLRDLTSTSLADDQASWLEALHTINAVQSWLHLVHTEVILFGTDEACDFISNHIPDAAKQCFPPPCINSDYESPTYDCLFANASSMANSEFIMYANSDMIFFEDLLEAMALVEAQYDDFLIIGSRTNLIYPHLIDFTDDAWATAFRAHADTHGRSHGKYALDYFLYRRRYTRKMPAFLVGRVRWDNWLLSRFIGSKTAVAVDVSDVVFAVHLMHGKVGASATRNGNQWNKDLLKDELIDPKKIGDLKSTDFRVIGSLATDGQTAGGSLRVRASCPACRIVRNQQNMEVALFKAATDNQVIVASVNYGYLDFALNWLCSIKRVGIDNYVFHAMDQKVYDALFEMGHPVIFYESDEAKTYISKDASTDVLANADSDGFAYGTVAYQALMNSRTEMIYRILQKGYDVLLCDVDIVFLRNPFLFLDMRYDILGGAHKDNKITGGFVFLRSNERTISMWVKVLHQHRDVLRLIQTTTSFNPHENTEQELLNKLLLTASSQEIQWGRISQDILADGRTFFINKSPQKKGIWPAAIHNNYIVGKENKYQRFVNVSLWFVNDNLKCVGFPSLLPAQPRQMPSLALKVLTFDRAESLKRLLKSLHKVDFQGDSVSLDIFIDRPEEGSNDVDEAGHDEVIRIAQKFSWAHGKKTVIIRETHYGLKGQWLNVWFPSSDHEIAMVLEDDNMVSPLFYGFLKQMLQRYILDPNNYDPRIYGIMFQNQHFIPGRYPTKPSEILDPSVQFYRYQQPSTWGPILFPAYWADFLAWQTDRGSDQNFQPLFSNMKTNEWFATRGGGRAVWSAYFMRYIAEKGLYSIYTNFPDGAALLVNYRDKGVNFKEDKGVNSPMLESLHGISLPESTHDLPLYDFHFNQILDDPSVLELRGVYSDTFNIVTH